MSTASLIIAYLAGGTFGAFVLAIFAAGRLNDDEDG